MNTDPEYYKEVNALLSEYADPSSRTVTNSFQKHLELQEAQEELKRLKREMEMEKTKQEEYAKLQEKVKQQRKERRVKSRRSKGKIISLEPSKYDFG